MEPFQKCASILFILAPIGTNYFYEFKCINNVSTIDVPDEPLSQVSYTAHASRVILKINRLNGELFNQITNLIINLNMPFLHLIFFDI